MLTLSFKIAGQGLHAQLDSLLPWRGACHSSGTAHIVLNKLDRWVVTLLSEGQTGGDRSSCRDDWFILMWQQIVKPLAALERQDSRDAW